MSYGDFNVKLIIEKLGFAVHEQPFVGDVAPIPIGEPMRQVLRMLRSVMVFSSEKARSEALIAPLLAEAAVRSHTHLFSGESFDVAPLEGLNGVVDFLLTRDAPGKVIVGPILCIVEAKKADIDSNALGQCMATMIAAQRFNKTPHPVHGCVTTGSDWQFLRLSDQAIQIEPTLYFENQMDLILGIILGFVDMGLGLKPHGFGP